MGNEFENAMKIGGGIMLIGFLLMFGVVALPFILIYAVFLLYKKNPMKQESDARTLNQQLYEQVLARYKNPITEEQIQRVLESQIDHDLPEDIRFHLKAHARILFDLVEFANGVPEPPAVANSIAGGRYRDQLSAIGALDEHAVFRALATCISIVRKIEPIVPDTTGSFLVPATYFCKDIRQLINNIIVEVEDQPALRKLDAIITRNFEELGSKQPRDNKSPTVWDDYFKGTPLTTLLSFSVPFSLPWDIRPEHQSIVVGSGHGKTTLFETMLVDDLDEDACIVVIDSQRGIVDRLADRVNPDRLIYISPRDWVPALNLFAVGKKDEAGVAQALAMYEFMFEGAGEAFTSKQALVYRYLARLCMLIPSANLRTMYRICEAHTETLKLAQPYISEMGEDAESFFAEFFKERGSEYHTTKGEVTRRLHSALLSPTFKNMFNASTMRIDFLKEIEAGKVIVVNTDKALLQGGAGLLGRMFIGMVMQTVVERGEETGKRVYMYVDEFGDYASDAPLMLELFSQGRKYRLCMIVALQTLGQLPFKLAQVMSASTSIKMAGQVSEGDLGTISSQLHLPSDTIKNVPSYTFWARFKGYGTVPLPVQPSPPVSTALRRPIWMNAPPITW